MAQIEEVIVAKLTGHAGLAALVGARVYPAPLPQRPTLPAVTYQRISTEPIQTRDSAQANFERPRFQFDVWTDSQASRVAVAAQLRGALATIQQASNPQVDVTLLANAVEFYEAEGQRWRAVLDAFIWHEV
jgi:hypothetical protein